MMEEMPATARGSDGVVSSLHEGFLLCASSCRGDDELVIVRREFQSVLSNGVASGRSMSCRGFVADGAHHVVSVGSSSSRWPHCVYHHMHHHHGPSSVGTCPHSFSTIVCSDVMCRRWDAQRVEGACGPHVGLLCICHRQQRQQQHFNRRSHLRKDRHARCGGGAIKEPHDPPISSCPATNPQVRAPPKKQQSRAAAKGLLAPPPPLPSSRGAPYVLCQHCALLLHLAPGTQPPSRSPYLLTLRCGSCLNFSTFSTRHLYAAPSATLSPPASLSPKEAIELTPMPGYGAFHEYNSAVSGASSLANCTVAHKTSADYENSKEASHLIGLRKHGATEIVEITTEDDVFMGSLESTRHAEAGAYPDHVFRHAIQGADWRTIDSLNGVTTCKLEDRITEARDCHNPESVQPQDKTTDDSFGNGYVLASDDQRKKLRESDIALLGVSEELQEDSHWDREQEIIIMSSVQSWVDSISPDTGYESDSSFHCSEKCPIPCEKHDRSLRRSPLHQHFGYKSPLELLEKILFSEDEEMRARTETNSTASSSSSPNNAGQLTDVRAPCLQLRAPSLRSWTGGATKPDENSPKSEERDIQRSLSSRLFKRGLGNHSPVGLKVKVVVNGRVLSTAAVKRAEERAGKIRPGYYWYDCKAGFWGVEGGPCLGILPPLIEELSYPMAGNCSNGNTQVYVNGRELHLRDLGVLSQRGFPVKAGRAYRLGFDGVLVDETTGLEVKHLGKLAPTVEGKGKGFGMFAGDIPQVMKTVVPIVEEDSTD